MPRHFSEADRQAIHAQLLDAGLSHFTQYGLRGMRVDDVCRDVGVAKGTFYNFFPHKEALFLAIADHRDAMHKREILDFFAQCDGDAADQLEKFFDLMVEKILADPLLIILSVPEDFAALMRKVPPDRVAHEEQKDLKFITQFCTTLADRGMIGPVEPRDIMGIMGLLVCLVLQRAILGPEQFAASCALLREMFVTKLQGKTL